MNTTEEFQGSEEEYVNLKKRALIQFLRPKINMTNIKQESQHPCIFYVGAQECDNFFVGTEKEAQRYVHGQLIKKLDKVLQNEIPKNLRQYFNQIKWLEAEKWKGVAYIISRDDQEYIEVIDNISFRIYFI